jgi:hypothetical protein
MTAMSAPRSASEPVPTTSPIAPERAGRVLIPGTDRTFEHRDVLRGLGLRWDPPTHAWHGSLSQGEVEHLRRSLGIAVRPVVTLESFPEPPAVAPTEPPRGPSPPIPISLPRRVVRDYSRTRVESRVVFRDADAPEGEGVEGSRFSLLEITSGLPDDSREADERAAERQLRDLRGRVKAARALVATTPGLRDVLQRDWQRAARFYARFGITEEMLRHGLPPVRVPPADDPHEAPSIPVDWLPERQARVEACLHRGPAPDRASPLDMRADSLDSPPEPPRARVSGGL